MVCLSGGAAPSLACWPGVCASVAHLRFSSLALFVDKFGRGKRASAPKSTRRAARIEISPPHTLPFKSLVAGWVALDNEYIYLLLAIAGQLFYIVLVYFSILLNKTGATYIGT